MIVAVDTSSPVPVYEQLRTQLLRLMASGQLPAGSRLPTIRQLAGDLGIASATVSRVYELLAHDGWVVGAGRHGTIVVGGAPPPALAADVEQQAEQLAIAASQLGVTERELRALVTDALRRLQDSDPPVIPPPSSPSAPSPSPSPKARRPRPSRIVSLPDAVRPAPST